MNLTNLVIIKPVFKYGIEQDYSTIFGKGPVTNVQNLLRSVFRIQSAAQTFWHVHLKLLLILPLRFQHCSLLQHECYFVDFLQVLLVKNYKIWFSHKKNQLFFILDSWLFIRYVLR